MENEINDAYLSYSLVETSVQFTQVTVSFYSSLDIFDFPYLSFSTFTLQDVQLVT